MTQLPPKSHFLLLLSFLINKQRLVRRGRALQHELEPALETWMWRSCLIPAEPKRGCNHLRCEKPNHSDQDTNGENANFYLLVYGRYQSSGNTLPSSPREMPTSRQASHLLGPRALQPTAVSTSAPAFTGSGVKGIKNCLLLLKCPILDTIKECWAAAHTEPHSTQPWLKHLC